MKNKKAPHEACAEILRLIYIALLNHQPIQNLLFEYLQKSQDLDLAKLNIDLESISNRYHFHLLQFKTNLKESDLLPYHASNQPGALPFGKIAIYLDHLYSAYNVGHIVRTNEAFRLGSIYFSKEAPPLEQSKIMKSSFGASQHVQLIYNEELISLPRPLIALDTFEDKKTTSLFDFTFPETFTLILGNEERGISKESLQMADLFLTIPLRGLQKSLNVASAFAIAAAYITHQKSKRLS